MKPNKRRNPMFGASCSCQNEPSERRAVSGLKHFISARTID